MKEAATDSIFRDSNKKLAYPNIHIKKIISTILVIFLQFLVMFVCQFSDLSERPVQMKNYCKSLLIFEGGSG